MNREVGSSLQALRFRRSAFWLVCVTVAVLPMLPEDMLPPNLFDWWDKAQHALAFAGLTVLGRLAYPHPSWVVPLGLLAYGGLIEVVQGVSGLRTGAALDWLADLVGIAIGFLLITVVHRLGRRTHAVKDKR